MKKNMQDKLIKIKNITKNMTIGDIVKNYPESAEIMFRYGLHCIGCHVSPFESLEEGAKSHGLSDERIDKMIEEINERIVKKKK